MLSLLNIGLTHYSLGRYEKAIDLYQQSRIIAHDLGDQKWEANSLSELGVVFRSLGQYEKAIDFSQQSLDISRELGDRSGEASSLAGLGNIYLNQGQYRQAIASHSESLSIKRDIGEYDGEADSLSSLGVASARLANMIWPSICINKLSKFLEKLMICGESLFLSATWEMCTRN